MRHPERAAPEVAGANAAGDLVTRLLGPTALYLGENPGEFARTRIDTVGRIFRCAEARLGKQIEKPGTVPPRVLQHIVNDGSYATDELAIEYLGGVLAASRSLHGRDDRGARIARLVNALSIYQLRTHYLIYATVRSLFGSRGLALTPEGRRQMKLFIPTAGYIEAMRFVDAELGQVQSLLTHVFFGLLADDLIEGDFQIGSKEVIARIHPAATEAGIVCQPSTRGVELLLWAFAKADKQLIHLFAPDFNIRVAGLPECVAGAQPLRS